MIAAVDIARPTPSPTMPGSISAYSWPGAESPVQSAPAAATRNPVVARRSEPTLIMARPARGATSTKDAAIGVIASASSTG